MKKGKKKDEKIEEEEAPSIASLSLSDTVPSTSQQQPSDVGLGFPVVTSKKKKKPQNNAPSSMEIEPCVAGSAVKQEESKPPCEAVKPMEGTDVQKRKEDDDDDGEALGLRLGGRGKKNRRKKKKSETAVPVQSVFQTLLVPVTQSGGQLQSAPPPTSSSGPQPTSWSGPQPTSWSGPPPSWGRGQSRPLQTSQSEQRFPEPTLFPVVQTVSAQQTKQGRGRGRDSASKTDTPGKVDVMSKQPPASTVSSQALAPTCLYKIPDKVYGRTVPARHIKLFANYLEMTIKPIKIYRYDVIFNPDKPKKFIPIAYALAVKKNFSKGHLAFDQRKNVYSFSPLPGVPEIDRLKCEVSVTDANGKNVIIEVSFKYTGTVDLNTILTYMKTGGTSLNPPTEAIQAIDIILRQGTLESYVKAGRQFFKRPARPLDLGDGLEMWTGLFQSAIFTSRPFINIDVAHKGFPRSQLLIDAYTRDFKLETNKTVAEQRGRGVEAFQQFLKGLRVTAYIGGDVMKGPQREFICNELVECPRRMFFRMNEGAPSESKCSVFDYFEKEKKIRIRYPNMNCVWVGPKDKRIYYPMEFLQITYGQVSNKQLNEFQLPTLVRESATPPLDRKKKIEEVIADMNYSNSEYFKKFGLDISNKFITVDAKVLQAPRLEVGGTTVEPRRGVWQSRRLLKPHALDSWGMISLDTDPRNSFDQVINMIITLGRDMGMTVTNPKMVVFNVRPNELMRTLQTFKDKKVDFLFVIISARGRDYYHKLKRTAERDVGILTQCIKEFTATRKLNDQTVRNIMLKVNSKLMGINHALDNRSTPACLQHGKIMLVGADVTHPSPEQSSIPSIAAVTASIDVKHTIYNITLSVQTPKKEMIVDFENMMVEHLNEFEKRQRELPSKIFVFRDGVSEGQFAQVMNSELQAVHNAYKRKIGPASNKRPEVLFLLVQKRHHTRLFLPDSPHNVEPGTVVDSHIVHPKELDFYLVSHQAIKGTARPTRYHAVCNDGRIAQDEVEQLAFYLCHLYARCSRSVSYPTPTYYAHLACMRARSLTYGDKFCNEELERAPQRLRVLERILETSKMFFV